jgi:hypothetical protein
MFSLPRSGLLLSCPICASGRGRWPLCIKYDHVGVIKLIIIIKPRVSLFFYSWTVCNKEKRLHSVIEIFQGLGHCQLSAGSREFG